MQTIVFENPGEIDLRSISTFGVSVKEGDNPIGFFGTGLKYAIAVLLRAGHQVHIFSGERTVVFATSTESVRDQAFDFVTMSVDGAQPTSIGFTTELGKQWELWMAYREIACNCKDENGIAARWNDVSAPAPKAGCTRVVVTGDDFAEIHHQRELYLLEDAPYAVHGSLEIRDRPSNAFFYRGVRVQQLQHKALYTYNETSKLTLTEDRTLKNYYDYIIAIARAVLRSDDERFIRQMVTAPVDSFEGQLDYHGWSITPGEAFLTVVGECTTDRLTKINTTALRVWNEATQRNFRPREIGMTKVQQMTMEKALDFCSRIGFQIRDSYPIVVVESLGEGCLGLAKDETIFIAERVFHLGGTKQLASTLIEEYLHLRQGWKDLTRELQSFLFDKVVSLGEELMGEPL